MAQNEKKISLRSFLFGSLLTIAIIVVTSVGYFLYHGGEHPFDRPTPYSQAQIEIAAGQNIKYGSNAVHLDSKINAADFFQWYYTAVDDTGKGVQIYFAVYNSKISAILAAVGNSGHEYNYHLITNPKYKRNEFMSESVISNLDTVKKYIKKYRDGVKIFGAPIDTSDSMYKISRFYEIDSIIQLFKDNIPGFDSHNFNAIKSYSIRLTHAYISYEYSPMLCSEYPEDCQSQNSHFLMGHTILFSSCCDWLGRDFIDENTQIPLEARFEGMYLEVGKPCPPLCGAITWEDLK